MREITAKRLLSPHKATAFWFDVSYTMNLYRGCVYGCIYCDSRSDCYHNEDFDTIAFKNNGLELLESELKSKRIKGVIGMGSMSDPYNPFETKTGATRGALELIHRYGFGLHLTTKSLLITRDIDLLKAIGEHSPVTAGITITTTDDSLASKIEPHAPASSQRFKTVQKLAQAGIFTGIMMMPVLPYVNDTFENMEQIVDLAADHGAGYIYPWFGVTLRTGQREYFYKGLDKHYPGLKERYIRAYGALYECRSPHYERLLRAFMDRCKHRGLLCRMEDIVSRAKASIKWEQGSFGL